MGYADPTTTLAIYARVIRRANRDALRAELRALPRENASATDEPGKSPGITGGRCNVDHDDRKASRDDA